MLYICNIIYQKNQMSLNLREIERFLKYRIAVFKQNFA